MKELPHDADLIRRALRAKGKGGMPGTSLPDQCRVLKNRGYVFIELPRAEPIYPSIYWQLANNGGLKKIGTFKPRALQEILNTRPAAGNSARQLSLPLA